MLSMHLASLSSKHAQIEAKLEQEAHHPQPDSLRIARLKKEKLRLKEQLARPQ